MSRKAEGAPAVRAISIILMAVLTAVLTGVLAGCDGGDVSAGGTAAAPHTPGVQPPDPAADAVAKTALGYVRALHSTSGRDDGPQEWVARVRPYATAAWYDELRDTGMDSGGAGDDWAKVERRNLRPRFERLDAHPVVEAPNTADRHYIRVAYSLSYVGEDGKKVAGLGSDGPRPMILVLTRSGGRWLVSDDHTGKAG